MRFIIITLLLTSFNSLLGQLHPKDIEYFSKIGKEQGMLKIDSLINITPDKKEIIFVKAIILSSIYQDNEGAINTYKEFLKLSNDSIANAGALGNIANNYYQLGNIDEARKSLDEGLKLNPEDPYLLHQRGLVIEENSIDSLKIQERYYRKSLEKMYKLGVDKKDSTLEPMILGNLGFNLYHQKRFEESKSYLEQSLSIDSTAVNVLNNLGNVLQRLGLYEESQEYYDQALKINPNYLFSINGKANSYFKMHNLNSACQNWKKVINLGYVFREEWRDQYDIEDPKILISKFCKN